MHLFDYSTRLKNFTETLKNVKIPKNLNVRKHGSMLSLSRITDTESLTPLAERFHYATHLKKFTKIIKKPKFQKF